VGFWVKEKSGEKGGGESFTSLKPMEAKRGAPKREGEGGGDGPPWKSRDTAKGGGEETTEGTRRHGGAVGGGSGFCRAKGEGRGKLGFGTQLGQSVGLKKIVAGDAGARVKGMENARRGRGAGGNQRTAQEKIGKEVLQMEPKRTTRQRPYETPERNWEGGKVG